MTNDLRQRVADAIEVADIKTKGPLGEGEFYLELADAAIAAMSEWRPIEEAPTGEMLLVCIKRDNGVTSMFMAIKDIAGEFAIWYGRGARCKPTHFMPLPLPPEGE